MYRNGDWKGCSPAENQILHASVERRARVLGIQVGEVRIVHGHGSARGLLDIGLLRIGSLHHLVHVPDLVDHEGRRPALHDDGVDILVQILLQLEPVLG